ncbi:Hvo_1808 family surface protein [Haloarcula marina]|uniref:Hvo_1808 family surface protein n=1 Tax=Haloarcula marina TaxID=2961574 RepID=UPI0020B856F5|nr:Hvo_1808 family surface protein [Halomicroarcula marina]
MSSRPTIRTRALSAVLLTAVVCLAATTAMVGTSAAQTGSAEADFEPNDDFANATAIAPGTYSGLNISDDDVDIYAVELEQGESLSAEIGFSHSVGDLELHLYGPDQTVQQASVSATDNESVSTVAGESGTYYLVVFGFQGATGPYDLNVVTTGGTAPDGAAGPDRFEPNDDVRNATRLQPGTYDDLNVTAGDIDVYAVGLTAGESLSASINFSHEEGDLDLFLLGANGTVRQSSTSETDGENVSYVAGETGTYYVVVTGFQNATNDYSLTLDTTGTGPPTAEGEFEPNDDFANATAIDPGTYDGLEITEDDVDIYAVELEAGESLSAEIEFSHSVGDLELFLLGPEQSVRQASVSSTDNESVSTVATESGTYYLAVAGYQGATGPYNLSVAVSGGEEPATTPDRFEPNDDVRNATRLQPGTYEDLSITEDDLDAYAVGLTAGESVSASINFSHEEGDLDLFLLGANGSVVGSSTSETDNESVSYVAGETGTYYVVVTGFLNGTGPYDLTISTAGTEPPVTVGELEPNNDFGSATPVETGTYTGLNITKNDLDVYAVELESGESLAAEIDFSHSVGDLDLFLLGPDGAERQSSTSVTDGESVSYVATESGTYYLVVVGFQGATGPYEMTIETSGSAQSPATDRFEPNNDFSNATALDPGTYEGLEISENDLDVYTVELAAGESLSASIGFSHAQGDLDFFLVDPDGSVVRSSTSVTDGESVTYVAPAAGTYSLVVTGYRGATGPYELTIETSGAGNGTQSAVGPQLADPETDRLGWENGYWANESVDLTVSDGLNESERAALVARGMARVEAIRDREFQRDVEFDVVAREEYASNQSRFDRLVGSRYYNQVYEATFMVDEETDAYDVVVGEDGATVGGFYAIGQDRFVLVVEDPDRPRIDEGVLVHELTHALQDQVGLLDGVFTASGGLPTADERTAALGLIEGDANYVMDRYEARCQNGTWRCVATRPSNTSASGADVNLGVYLRSIQPYSDGPVFVDRLRERGGWDAVDAAYDAPPVATEQTIHPERYPDERPQELDAETAPDGEWRQFDTETIGEAWLYAMFWYQDREYDIPVVDSDQVLATDGGPYDTYNYTSVPTEGWGNDRLSLYTNGSANGYVWTTQWDSEADAQQFRDAYVQVLRGHGGESVGESTWRIPEGEAYADAFRVVRDGQTVTVVNGPSVDSLSTLRPSLGNESEGDS